MTLVTVHQLQVVVTGHQVDDGEEGSRIIPCAPVEGHVVEVLRDGVVTSSRLFWSKHQAATMVGELCDSLERRPDTFPYIGRLPSPHG